MRKAVVAEQLGFTSTTQRWGATLLQVLPSWSNELCRPFEYHEPPPLFQGNRSIISASTRVCLATGWRLSNFSQEVWLQDDYQHTSSPRCKVFIVSDEKIPHCRCLSTSVSAHPTSLHLPKPLAKH